MVWRCVSHWLLLAAALALGGCAHLAGPYDVVAMPEEAAHDARAEALIATAHANAAAFAVTPAAVVVEEPRRRYLLDTGDKLRIFVYGQPNLSRIYTVDHEGKVAIPLIGAIRARGLTTYALESAIRSRLGTQYVKDPHVTVDVQQNRPFFILGEVRSAGQYPYVSGMTVETAVAIAGGFAERASERRARISRKVGGLTEIIEVAPDYEIEPGDTVYIPERFF